MYKNKFTISPVVSFTLIIVLGLTTFTIINSSVAAEKKYSKSSKKEKYANKKKLPLAQKKSPKSTDVPPTATTAIADSARDDDASAKIVDLKREDLLAQVLLLYKKGAYGEVVNFIDSLKLNDRATIETEDVLIGSPTTIGKQGGINKELKATLFYFQGLSYNKLQQFDKGSESFDAAIKVGVKAPDVYYEQGQALYAGQELIRAKKAFALSVKNKYLIPSSYYYMGHMSQVLEQYHLALRYYKRIENASKDIAQAASFQIGEIILVQAEKQSNPATTVKDYVIPQYQKANDIDDSSSLSAEIKKKMAIVKELYDLDENKMINGRKIPPKTYSVSFKEGVSYDSNIISEADHPTSKATYKDTTPIKSELSAKKRFAFASRYLTNPQLRVTHSYHSTNRSAPDIKKNDAYTVQPQVDFQFEHKLFTKPATLIVDGDYNYTEKDVNKDEHFHFYSRTISYSLGEKASLLQFSGFGEATIKVKGKEYYGTTSDSRTHTNAISLSQPYAFNNRHMLLSLVSADFTEATNKISDSQNSYNIRFDYIIPELFWQIQCSSALSITILDTKLQNSTRGTEKTLNPSVSFSRPIYKKLEVTIKYDFTKNYSKNKSAYAYTKHVAGLDLQVSL